MKRHFDQCWAGWLGGSVLGLALQGNLAGWVATGQDLPPGQAPRSKTITVRDPEAGHPHVDRKKEHCAVPATLLAEIGSAVGRQVRIERSASEFALFTVVESLEGTPAEVVAIGRLGRGRLGSTEAFNGRISANLPRSDLSDDEAQAQGELVERLDDDGVNTGLLIMAPHGGQLEPPTDLQAERVAQQLGIPRQISTWRCRGYPDRGGKSAFDRWHITSTEISAASFPLLGKLAGRRFRHAVSFHGMVEDRVLIGGTGPYQLKTEIRDAIREALAGTSIRVDLALTGDANGGQDPKNIVNRYAADGGIQIEQSARARRDHWKEIADAVAQVYGSKL